MLRSSGPFPQDGHSNEMFPAFGGSVVVIDENQCARGMCALVVAKTTKKRGFDRRLP